MTNESAFLHRRRIKNAGGAAVKQKRIRGRAEGNEHPLGSRPGRCGRFKEQQGERVFVFNEIFLIIPRSFMNGFSCDTDFPVVPNERKDVK